MSLSSHLPKHVAIVMDGNGRWAEKQNLPRAAGHRAGINAVRAVIQAAVENDIQVLTLFAFGQENWRRPAEEVHFLMGLLLLSLRHEIKKLHQNNIRLCVIGDRSPLPPELLREIERAEKLTTNNTGLQLLLALNYSGCWDITEATRTIATKIKNNELTPEMIDVNFFAKHLITANFPDVDLFIRTSGEKRISNFLLWQLAYAEFYFTDILWPDFSREHFENALTDFAKRQRRFGYTGTQIIERQSHA